MSAPPAGVLAAFGVTSTATRLPGGQGRSWRAADLVLKPVDSPREHDWVSAAYAAWPVSSGVRVPRPLLAPDGSWAVDGWAAYSWLEGATLLPAHDPGIFRAAAESFHDVTRTMAPPAFLTSRADAWAVGDRVAWEAEPASGSGPLRELLDEVLSARRPLDLPMQVVHGDLPGNVLWSDADGPAVIDWAPYHRPRGWALAVAAADAVCWQDAPIALLDEWADEPCWPDLLLRALAYRLATRVVVGDPGAALPERAVVDAVLARRRG